VGSLDLPNGRNELHHFGWNARSSHPCACAPDPHMERRYLVLPGTHRSRIYVVDTVPNPRAPRLVTVIEGRVTAVRPGGR
jgi:selenium-binding protein 1